ncbi:MAG: CHAD domain-containing protein [Chitinophagaceae bacterium]|nr:CHAD domain-containing protein [Chitinophagaceae bacterium]
MAQTQLQLYYDQRIKHVFNHLHDFDIHATENALHDFRVEIKKLKAILKFLKTIYPKQKLKKSARELNHIFQEAGEIRESQLMQQWLNKNELNLSFNGFFPAANLQKMVRDFHGETNQFKHDIKELNENVSKYIAATNEILAEHYVRDLQAHMDKMIRKNCPETEWHSLRKLIKQWMYAINWLDKKEDADIAYYQKLQESIGYWHDVEVIKESLVLKKIHLSPDVELQKAYTLACDKLNHSLRYREKQIVELFAKKELIA